MSNYTIQHGSFNHVSLGGTSAEVGAALAQALQSNQPYLNFFTSADADPARLGCANFAQMEEQFERACPGVVDEIHAFAAALNTRPERIMYYQISSLAQTNCSQMVALPAITRGGRVLVGRSYEWKPAEDDLCLCTTAVTGKLRHIGFTCMLMGRMDGLNESGLSVTMSGGMAAGLPHEWTRKTGLNFWVALRGLLENCATTREALERLRRYPPASNVIFLIADRSGEAAVAELSAGEMEVHLIGPGGPDEALIATNHFTLPGMAPLNRHQFILDHSLPRRKAILTAIAQDRPGVTRDTFRTVLTREIPDGCFGPYYDQGFGTLWSMLIDLSALELEICFGAPSHNPWRTFTLDTPGGQSYPAQFPQR